MQLSIVILLFDTLNLHAYAAVLTKKGVFNLLHAFGGAGGSTWDCQVWVFPHPKEFENIC